MEQLPLILITALFPPIAKFILNWLDFDIITPLVLYAFSISLFIAGHHILAFISLAQVSWMVFTD